MDRRALGPCLALTLLIAAAFLSRTALAESPLGAHAARQARTTSARFLREARLYCEMARENKTLLLAVLHNSEGLAHARCALRLLEEHGLSADPDVLDVLEELRDDQDELLEEVRLRYADA